MTQDQWIDVVSERLQRSYAITLNDAGLDESDIARFYASEPDPQFFVDWFVRKFDLTSLTEIGVSGGGLPEGELSETARNT
jgi:hypothetical protein